jgi:hypothetical protein
MLACVLQNITETNCIVLEDLLHTSFQDPILISSIGTPYLKFMCLLYRLWEIKKYGISVALNGIMSVPNFYENCLMVQNISDSVMKS